MDESLLSQEKAALEAITTCMKKHLNEKVKYTSQKVKEKRGKEFLVITKQDEAFWDKCIYLFEKEMKNRFGGSRLILRETPNSTKNGTAKGTSSGKRLAASGKTDAGSYFADVEMEPTENVYFLTSMYNLKCAVNLLGNFNLNDEQEDDLKEQLFQLCQKIEKYEERNTTNSKPKGSILGSTDFRYLAYMLDLHQKDICKYLPYLLTAYTFNAWNSSFFYEDNVLLSLICATKVDDDNLQGLDGKHLAPIDSSEYHKKCPGIQRLSQVFSLKKCGNLLMSRPDLSSGEEASPLPRRPTPLPQLFDGIDPQKIKKPYIRYREVLDQVFDVWCNAVYYATLVKKRPQNLKHLAHFIHSRSETISSTNIKRLRETHKSPSIMKYRKVSVSDADINWEDCHKLYRFHTDKTATN